MAEVFNTNPNWGDLNELFPVLNSKVGLDYEQWRMAVENIYYLKNHLGLADIYINSVTTNFTAPGEMSAVELTHSEKVVDGKTLDYLDFIFNIPSPKIETEITSEIVQDVADVGVDLEQEPIYGTGSLSNKIVGYKFKFNAKLTTGGDAEGKVDKIAGNGRITNDETTTSVSRVREDNVGSTMIATEDGLILSYTSNSGNMLKMTQVVLRDNEFMIDGKNISTEDYVDEQIRQHIIDVLNTEV